MVVRFWATENSEERRESAMEMSWLRERRKEAPILRKINETSVRYSRASDHRRAMMAW